ncbi:hypothetical protein [Halobacteriovorax sp. HLS]|uniref:hypothetical protein n=1 Tax=Halobacteriovorax sp. HLS TaxID=2234000 RepID=UPI000FD8BE92|nr:hypothetical protein [Halobacteriovorax sp. HLS]
MKKLLLSIFLVTCMAEVFALPGMVSVQYDFSKSQTLFSSEAIQCQNQFTQGISPLEQLSNNMMKFNCNNQVEHVPYCRCVKKISSNGLTLTAEDEALAKETLNNVSDTILLDSFHNDLKSNTTSYREFMGSSHFDELFDKCFSGKDGVFKEIDTLKKKKDSELSSLEKAKLEYYHTLLKDYDTYSPIYKNVPFDMVMGRLLLEKSSSKNREITEKDLSSFEHIPLLNILNEEDRVEFVTQRSSIEISNKNIRNILTDSKQRLLKHFDNRCLEVSNQIESQMDSYKPQKEAIFQNILDTGGQDFNDENDSFSKQLRIAAQKVVLRKYPEVMSNEDTKEKVFKELVDEVIFNVDKYFCKHNRRVVSPPTYENLDEQEASNNMVKLYASREEVVPEILELDRKIEGLKGEVVSLIDTTREDKESLEFLIEIENLINPENKTEDGHFLNLDNVSEEFTSKLKSNPFLDEISVKHIDENGKSHRIVNLESLKDFKDYFKMSVDANKEVNDKNLTLLAEKEKERAKLKEKLQAIDDEINKTFRGLEVRVGTSRAEFIRDRSKENAKTNHHLGRVLNIAKTYKDTQRTNTIDDLTYMRSRERGLKTYFKELSASETLVSSATEIKKKENTQKSVSSELINRDDRSEVISKVPKSDPYFSIGKRQSSLDFNKVKIQDSVKSDTPSKRETELLKQLDRLKKYIEDNNKNEEVVKTNIEDKSIDALKKEVELQKVKNEKIRLENELQALQSKPATGVQNDEGATKVSTRESFDRERVSESEDFKISRPSVTNGERTSSSKTEVAGSKIVAPANTSSSSSLANNDNSKIKSTSGAVLSGSNVEADRLNLLGIVDSSSISLRKSTGVEATQDSRVVKLEFDLDTIPVSNREVFLESLLLEGEDSIVIELPDGEKLILENKKEDSRFVGPIMKSNERELASKKKAHPRRSRILYKDLQKILNSSLISQ